MTIQSEAHAIRTDREKARDWARELIEKGQFVIIDTETTGLDTTDEVVAIAIIDPAGAVLLDSLIRPSKAIPEAARSVHGITDEQVKDAPTFTEVWPRIAALVEGKEIVIYNATYDLRMLVSSLACAGGAYLDDVSAYWARYAPAEAIVYALKTSCAMEWYSQWVGDWSSWHGYRWQKLPGGDHSALGDCRATLAVIRQMAGIVEKASGE